MFLVHLFIPNEYELLQEDWKQAGAAVKGIPGAFRDALLKIMGMPEMIGREARDHMTGAPHDHGDAGDAEWK